MMDNHQAQNVQADDSGKLTHDGSHIIKSTSTY